jgi:hypothetical protein
MDLSERLDRRLDKSGECWVWTGCKDKKGHARVNVDGENVLAHRVVWELKNGPIPEKVRLFWSCGNPACCNPEHMYLGTLSARLNQQLDKSGGCWVWMGGRQKLMGYGKISLNGKDFLTHRVAWELANGPIPADMQVLHSCDNPPCCNPAHLHLGTHADNMREKTERGRTTRITDEVSNV